MTVRPFDPLAPTQVPQPQALTASPEEVQARALPTPLGEEPEFDRVVPLETPGTIDETEEGITTVSALDKLMGLGKGILRRGQPVTGANLRVTVRGKEITIPAAMLDDPEGFVTLFRGQKLKAPGAEAAAREHMTVNQARKIADELGLNANEVMASPLGTVLNFERAQLAVDTGTAIRANLAESGRKFLKGELSEEALHDEFVSAVKFHQGLVGVKSELARSLWTFRQGAGQPEKVIGLGEAAQTFMHNPQRLAYALSTLHQDSLKWTVLGTARRGWSFLTSAWFNGMLSLPSTQLANIMGNAMTIGTDLFTRSLAAGYGSFTGSHNIPWSELLARTRGMVGATTEAFLAAKNTHVTGISQFGAQKFSHPTVEDPQWIESGVGMMFNYLNYLSPTRFLHTVDEFFKVTNAAAEKWGHASRIFDAEGGSLWALGKKDPGVHFETALWQALTDPRVDQRAAAFAHYQTLTQPLEGMMAPLSQVLSHPAMRPVSPFYRIMTNMTRWNFERFPALGLLARENRQIIATAATQGATPRTLDVVGRFVGGSTPDLDLLVGKQLFGAGVFSLIAWGAQAGVFTGAGPTDHKLRQLKEQGTQGWRPFSIYFGPKVGYLSYDRFGLIGSLVGLVSSFTEISGELDADQLDEVATAIHLAFSKELEDTHFLGDVKDMLEGVLKDKLNPEAPWFTRLFQTAVPNVVKAVRRETDDIKREVDTLLQAFQNVIPYWSKGLKPQVNYVGDDVLLDLGMPPYLALIAPTRRGAPKKGDVTAEIMDETLRLGIVVDPVSKAFFGPEDKQFGVAKRLPGVQLTDEQHYEYQKLAGNDLKFIPGPEFAAGFGVRVGQKSLGLKDALNALLDSPVYTKLTDGPQGAKAVVWRNLVNAARSAARAEMLGRHQDLMTEYVERAGERALLLGGEELRAPIEHAVRSMLETIGR